MSHVTSSPHRGNPFFANFLGHAPNWYKQSIIICLLLNPVIFFTMGPFAAGWCILMQFIATLALALKCYPLLPGGLLLLEAVALGMVPLELIHTEIAHNLPILFLVLFVVTGVYFLRDLLAFLFIKAILNIRTDVLLGLFFLILGTILSALLDAMTVVAVVSSVLYTLFIIYHRIESMLGQMDDHDPTNDDLVRAHRRAELDQFRAALRGITMLAAIGTMLGGIMTLIGEPQNLLIGAIMEWDFEEFFIIMSPISMSVFATGVLTAIAVIKLHWLDYGTPISEEIRALLTEETNKQLAKRSTRDTSKLIVQAIAGLILIAALVLHISEVYVAGLILLIIVTSFNGASEHDIGEAVKEGGPFVFVLAVFFGIVAMIHSQHLFDPVSAWVLSFEGPQRLLAYYGATGALSAISDNVFVASLFITEANTLHEQDLISRDEFENIAVAINMGTNIPSISTPNGQAAFLFLLMSRLAPLIKLSYMRMMLLALPFAVTCSVAGALSLYMFY